MNRMRETRRKREMTMTLEVRLVTLILNLLPSRMGPSDLVQEQMDQVLTFNVKVYLYFLIDLIGVFLEYFKIEL